MGYNPGPPRKAYALCVGFEMSVYGRCERAGEQGRVPLTNEAHCIREAKFGFLEPQ